MNDKKYIIDIPELMKEWDWEKNKDLDPNKLVVGSEKKAWWICQKCKGTWQTQKCVRKKHGCPYCTGQKVRKGINDFATLYPDLLKEWDWDKNSESGFFPDEIMPGTKKKIFWKCKECGFMWQAAVKDRTKKNGRATGCPQCKRKKLSEYHLTPVVGINDLESCYPEIAKEWNYDKNINLLPSQVLKGSATVVWWKCYICGNEWKTSVHSRTGRNSQTGCPSCSAQRTGDINAMPIQGENDLETLYPKLLKEWNYEKNTNLPSTYFAKSNKKVWWKCKYGHEWQASIVNRVKGRNCPICKKEYKVSFPEKTLYYYISKYYPDAIENYKTAELKNKELDIYIPKLKIAVEYDGKLWHKNINKDLEKDMICKSLGIKLIRIREKGLPVLNSSSIVYEVLPSKDNHDYLNECISWLFSYINISRVDINIERDNEDILKLMNLSRKSNSILKHKPEISQMWDNEKNGNLTPDMFSIGSEKTIWLKCTECGKSYQIKVKDAYKKRTTKCIECAYLKLKPGVNDFKTIYPRLANEYDYEKNKIRFEDLNLGERKNKFFWKCSKCGYEWKASIDSRINSKDCPKCASIIGANTRKKNLIKKEGSLATNYPELAKEWHPIKNGDLKPEKMTCKNKTIVWWKCSICGNEWQSSIALRTQGFGRCKKCDYHVIKK